MSKLTVSQVRALAAVAAGRVARIYRANGNVLHGPSGVSSRTLWELDTLKLIEDGPHVGHVHRQTLTPKGRAAFEAATGGKLTGDSPSPRAPRA